MRERNETHIFFALLTIWFFMYEKERKFLTVYIQGHDNSF